jgi:hypothetical protein
MQHTVHQITMTMVRKLYRNFLLDYSQLRWRLHRPRPILMRILTISLFKGHVYQKPYPDCYDKLPYLREYRVSEFSKFSGEDGKTTLELVGQFIL